MPSESKCPECGGKGTIMGTEFSPSGWATGIGTIKCPVCDGSGDPQPLPASPPPLTEEELSFIIGDIDFAIHYSTARHTAPKAQAGFVRLLADRAALIARAEAAERDRDNIPTSLTECAARTAKACAEKLWSVLELYDSHQHAVDVTAARILPIVTDSLKDALARVTAERDALGERVKIAEAMDQLVQHDPQTAIYGPCSSDSPDEMQELRRQFYKKATHVKG